jgi:hypothetical protein
VLGIANGNAGDLQYVAAAIATTTGFILHEMGHKFVAVQRGYLAHFQIWIWGIALTLITTVVSATAFCLEHLALSTLRPLSRLGPTDIMCQIKDKRIPCMKTCWFEDIQGQHCRSSCDSATAMGNVSVFLPSLGIKNGACRPEACT